MAVTTILGNGTRCGNEVWTYSRMCRSFPQTNMSAIMIFKIKLVVSMTFHNGHRCDVCFSRTRTDVTATLDTMPLVFVEVD